MANYPVRKRRKGSDESVEAGVRETTMYAVDLFDRTNKKSVINLLPDSLQAKVFAHSRERPDLFKMNEKELRTQTKPTPTECRLRLAFWNEFNEALAGNSSMVMSNIFTGICSQQYFDSRITNEANCMAWLLCPPANYIVALEEMLMQSQMRLREILDEDPVVDGEVNFKLAELQLKIHQTVENRLRGSTVQRTQLMGEIRTTNMNVNANLAVTPEQAEHAIAKMVGQESLAEIDEKLASIRRKREHKEKAWTRPPSSTTTDENKG